MHIPLEQVPNPQLQMLSMLVITGGMMFLPILLFLSSLPTCMIQTS